MDMDGLLSLACDPTASRVIDALMELPAIAKKDKRKLTLAFVGTGAGGGFERLVDDRIGSRVGDRLWAAAEPYLKVGKFNFIVSGYDAMMRKR
jgi:nucleolar protein 9